MRGLAVAVHDVAPDTWSRCAVLLDFLDTMGCRPVTLLAIPHYHHARRMVDSPETVAAIDRRLAGGDEVVLHGYTHLDESPPARKPAEWLRRTFLTQREGEFEALTEVEAAARIARGREELGRLGWSIEGFVPPAWLAGPGSWRALHASGLRYATRHGSFADLSSGRSLAAPCFTASSRAAWRRLATRGSVAALARAWSAAPLLRVALHPVDTGHPDIMEMWRTLLAALLSDREALTKRQAFERLSSFRYDSVEPVTRGL
jgi:predicted deacetylase